MVFYWLRTTCDLQKASVNINVLTALRERGLKKLHFFMFFLLHLESTLSLTVFFMFVQHCCLNCCWHELTLQVTFQQSITAVIDQLFCSLHSCQQLTVLRHLINKMRWMKVCWIAFSWIYLDGFTNNNNNQSFGFQVYFTFTLTYGPILDYLQRDWTSLFVVPIILNDLSVSWEN